MSQKFDFVTIEQKVLAFFQKVALMVRNVFKGVFVSTQNYLRSKTRHIPLVLPKRRREVIESILDQKTVQENLQAFARECGMSLEHVEQTFRGYLHEIASDLSYLTMPFWDFLLTWIFETIYEGIEVNTEALEKIRPLLGVKPVVFVPNHRSHMDYLIMSYVLHLQSMPVPYICAGANLSFWPRGAIFRKSGAFFIRRSYDGNRLYAMSVQAYIEDLIREKSCLEFFIEGTRSRTGKLLSPRMGILSAIAQAYANGASEDVILVPTSFTYESVLEDKSYTEEQAGAHKKDENFWDLLKLRKHLKRRKGKVYVRLGDAVSMKDYFPMKDFLQGADKSNFRERVQDFAYELTYGINKSAIVTPASLTANALLTHPERSISESEVYSKIDAYLDYLKFKECRLSEPLQNYQRIAIRDSLRTYARTGLIEEYRDHEEALYRVVEEKRPLLDYYKNTSVHFFVSMGVLAAILRKKESAVVPLQEVYDEFSSLQDLFQQEFTFSRRQPLQAHVQRLLDYLNQSGATRPDGESLHVEKEHPLLALLSAPIQSFLESYYVVWKTLAEIGQRRWEKRELIDLILERSRILYIKEEIQNPEAASKFTIQNALAAFKALGMIREDMEGWGKKKLNYYQVVKMDEALGLKLKSLIAIPSDHR